MDREWTAPFEVIVLVIGGVAAVVAGSVWLGAALALVVTGRSVSLSLADAASTVPRLASHLTEPAQAWPEPARQELPGPLVYWPCSLLGGAVVLGIVGAVALFLLRWRRVGSVDRRPLGVAGRPWFARAADLAPVLVRGPVAGRFIVARFGRWLVATEDASLHPKREWWPLVRAGRRGDRGAVALVGPTRSGKTTAAVAGILDWDGPAVLASVKSDLLEPTIAWRSQLGEVKVYDPVGCVETVTGHRAAWSPLRQADTITGAKRAARALCDAAPDGGVEGGLDFWLAQAEILLSALLLVAHHAGHDMGKVAEWVIAQDRPTEDGPGDVALTLDMLLASENGDVLAGASEAERNLRSVWQMEDRTRSSVYAAAQTTIWPWAEPGVAAASQGKSIDLPWLMSGANTVYLCSPVEDQQRLSPAFGGMIADLAAQAYRHHTATGRPLAPTLLLVIDEAGNTPLRNLPELASTLAGTGVLLVTIWQSLAQVEAAYGSHAGTVLTNHLTKVFYAGLSDPPSLQYISQVTGDAEIETLSRSAAEQGSGSTQWATATVPLAPPHVLRQMRPGDALMLHSTLPPAHVRTRPWFKDRRLCARSKGGDLVSEASIVARSTNFVRRQMRQASGTRWGRNRGGVRS